MSLDAIRDLRRSGYRPSMVFVVVGETNAPLDERSSVVVRASDNPAALDWRPLVGVTATVLTVQPLPGLMLDVLDALQAVNVKVFGAADSEGVYPLLMDADETHERLLCRAWELVCQ